MKRERRLGWVIGIVAVIASVVIFLIPFAFILVTAAKTTQEAANLDFSWPTTWQLWDNIKTVLTVRQFVVLRAFINSTTLTVFSVGAHGGSLRHDRLRAAAAILALERAGQLPDPGRSDHPAGGGADHLGAAGDRAVQADDRHDPGQRRLRHAVLRPAVPRVRLLHPPRAGRGGHRGRGRTAAAVLLGHPAAAQAGGDHGDRGAGGGGVQRLHRTAVLPARATRT